VPEVRHFFYCIPWAGWISGSGASCLRFPMMATLIPALESRTCHFYFRTDRSRCSERSRGVILMVFPPCDAWGYMGIVVITDMGQVPLDWSLMPAQLKPPRVPVMQVWSIRPVSAYVGGSAPATFLYFYRKKCYLHYKPTTWAQQPLT
jgi:hypothetical protein